MRNDARERLDMQALLTLIEHCRSSPIFFIKFMIKPLYIDHSTIKAIPEIERIIKDGFPIPYVADSGLKLEQQFALELLNQLEAYLEARLH